MYIIAAIAALSTQSKYIGCYKDTSDRDLNGYLSDYLSTMTVNSCINTCRSKGELSFLVSNVNFLY